jgi:putative PIN family toxin of toxin-antitoxin system
MKCWAIDTNVVVSGLLNPRGPSARVLDAVVDGRVKMVYDARLLAEYRDVLRRPRLKLKPEAIQAFLDGLRSQTLVNPTATFAGAPDPDDLPFIAAALCVPDKTIVTGNLADYPDEILNGVRILTPAQYQGAPARNRGGRPHRRGRGVGDHHPP